MTNATAIPVGVSRSKVGPRTFRLYAGPVWGELTRGRWKRLLGELVVHKSTPTGRRIETAGGAWATMEPEKLRGTRVEVIERQGRFGDTVLADTVDDVLGYVIKASPGAARTNEGLLLGTYSGVKVGLWFGDWLRAGMRPRWVSPELVRLDVRQAKAEAVAEHERLTAIGIPSPGPLLNLDPELVVADWVFFQRYYKTGTGGPAPPGWWNDVRTAYCPIAGHYIAPYLVVHANHSSWLGNYASIKRAWMKFDTRGFPPDKTESVTLHLCYRGSGGQTSDYAYVHGAADLELNGSGCDYTRLRGVELGSSGYANDGIGYLPDVSAGEWASIEIPVDKFAERWNYPLGLSHYHDVADKWDEADFTDELEFGFEGEEMPYLEIEGSYGGTPMAVLQSGNAGGAP